MNESVNNNNKKNTDVPERRKKSTYASKAAGKL